LADLTGTTAETAIRITRSLQAQGIIDIKTPGTIRVLDLNALNELAEI
jgi:CRP-like cAMP-binding protein